MHLAVWLYRPEIVEKLIKNGADPNVQDDNGETSLHIAVVTKQNSLAKFLISHGADLQIRNFVRNI